MSTRLDRLFVLLETGGSGVTREAAAQQLGEVVKLHPQELHPLLSRLHTYITSKSWETRIAAGKAVKAIITSVPQWNPQPQNIQDGEECSSKMAAGRLSLQSFNVIQVLQKGSYLMAADEKQFEIDEETSNMEPKARMAFQRQLVNQRLGLDVAEAIGINTEGIVSNTDLQDCSFDRNRNGSRKDTVVNIVKSEMNSAGFLSSRELNKARRNAKILAKQMSRDASENSMEEGPERKRQRLNSSVMESVDSDDEGKMVVDEGPPSPAEEGTEWPLDNFCSKLCTELFSPTWETRHGSATALREIIRVHGAGAGKSKTQTLQEMSWCHQAWLEDMAVRLICVLALDRFGDFVSDQVVAPVRETCAQALGNILQLLNVSGVWGVVRLLEMMLSWREWEARHGGLLGLKYLLAIRTDIRDDLLKHAYPHIYKGLQDEMDDVVAVAAACLVPVADAVITLLDKDVVTGLVATLWDALLDIDDLTASTSSILQLLAKILAHPGSCIRVRGNLEQLVPRLWPFLYHSNSAVRKSALTTLATLTVPREVTINEKIDTKLKIEPESVKREENCTTDSDETHSVSERLLNIKVEDIKVEQNITIVKSESNTQINEILKKANEQRDRTNNNNEVKSEDGIKKEVLQRSKSMEGCEWLFPIISPALTHIFQRSLLETTDENHELIFLIWEQMLECINLECILPAVCPVMSSWLYLIMGNPQLPLDPAFLLKAHHHKHQNKAPAGPSGCNLNQANNASETKFYLGGCELISKPVERQQVVIRARCAGAKLLGRLSNYIVQPMPGVKYSEQDTPILCYIRLLVNHLNSRSAVQRLAIGAVVREWALAYPEITCHSLLRETLLNCLTECVYYDEIAMSFSRLQQDSRDFIAMLRHYKLDLPESFTNAPVLTLEQIQNLSGRVALTLFNSAKLRPKVQVTLEERRKAIQSSVSQTSSDQVNLATMTQAIIAGALIRFGVLPEKLNPVIKPLMDSIKREQNMQLQTLAAQDLTKLLELCINRQPSPNNKIVKNLATFMCVDTEFTPPVVVQIDKSLTPPNKYKGILSLSWHQKNEEKKNLRRSTSVTGRGPGRPPGRPPANLKPEDPEKMTQSIIESENQQINEIQRRGCTTALVNIANYFDQNLPSKIPHLWEMICKPFSSIRPLETQSNAEEAPSEEESAQETVNWLQLMEVIVPALHPALVSELEGRLALMEQWLYHSYSAVRHMAGRVLGVLSQALTVVTVSWVVVAVLPILEEMNCSLRRQGAVEAVYQVISKLGLEIVPYIVLLIVPLLGGMSDPDDSVRLLSTQCFANLIRLLPLEGGVPSPPNLSEELTERKIREREFLQQLINPKEIKDYKIPVPIKAQLRSYQQNGVNWLYFLQQYRLHGILCDDMGLGKTLQSLCILAGSQYTKEQEREKKGDPSLPLVQSLVVCPPTLTGHWVYEIEKFISKTYLNPLHYTGPPVERFKLRRYVPEHNLIVASYDIVRNDIDFFSQIKWNYVILDEGHIIKNGKTKSSRAIKQLIAKHRVILSGTPIQNNVLELWSLFDFLMPCFLGTERQFMSRYSKPILASRDAKSSSAEQEAGVLAMESLHRQVLPFLLRRQKEDVLSDLPPKITQDYYCELSPLQAQLYEDFARSQARQNIDETLCSSGAKDAEGNKPHSHIFQALQYLRKVCNHPKLVVKPQHPEYPRIVAHLDSQNSSLSDINHSAKLPALKQLLLDCGIGVPPGPTATENVVSQHRALVFCQLKSMLDIIENDLLKAHLPGVSYLRLDGSVPAGSRHALVQRFNADPSIDLLLLTTQVGGLGLNLTGADTVIFVEHDWNPMRDLQAMDRAHRIGQKRVVNVYRLITQGTLEEKIMGLQKFKLLTANTVISQENASLLSMGTDQLLDLFTLENKGSTIQNAGGETSGSKRSTSTQGLGMAGASAVLEGLPDLWDQNQYDSEYNLDSWLHTLSK